MNELTSRKTLSAASLCVRVMLGVAAAAITGHANAATISGTVSDELSAPISGASVVANRQFDGNAFTPYQGVSVTAADGTYSFSSVPAGTYQLCVTGPGNRYVDPCIWQNNPVTVVVTDATPATSAALTASHGALLTINISDPNSLRKAAAGGKSGQLSIVDVAVRGAANRMPLSLVPISNTDTIATYATVVPYELTTMVVFNSSSISASAATSGDASENTQLSAKAGNTQTAQITAHKNKIAPSITFAVAGSPQN